MVDDIRSEKTGLTQERAMQNYELLQQTLNADEWDVLVQSEQLKMNLKEFKEKAKIRLNYRAPNFSPMTVATDCLVILDYLNVVFDNIKNRFEDSFRSILMVNEDMDELREGYTNQCKAQDQRIEELEEQVNELTEENTKLKDLLKKKESGIKPLADIIKIRIAELVRFISMITKLANDKEALERHMLLIQREVDNTIVLVNFKQQEIIDSKIDYEEMLPAFEKKESKEELIKEPEIKEKPEENPPKAKYKRKRVKYDFDENNPPDEFKEVDRLVYQEAYQDIKDRNVPFELALDELRISIDKINAGADGGR